MTEDYKISGDYAFCSFLCQFMFMIFFYCDVLYVYLCTDTTDGKKKKKVKNMLYICKFFLKIFGDIWLCSRLCVLLQINKVTGIHGNVEIMYTALWFIIRTLILLCLEILLKICQWNKKKTNNSHLILRIYIPHLWTWPIQWKRADFCFGPLFTSCSSAVSLFL